MDYKKEYGLPNSIRGKSFAAASKHIESKFKERNSIFDLNTKKELLSRLRDVQELQRQKLESKRQKVEGQNQMYIGGPEGEDDIITSPTFSVPNSYEQNNSGVATTFNPMFTPSTNIAQQMQDSNSTQSQSTSFWNKSKKFMKSEQGESLLGGIGLAISGLAPMIANRNAMKNLKPAKTVNPMTMNPYQVQGNFVNRQQLMRNMNEQASSQRYNMSQTGGNWGQYSQGLAGLNSGLISTTGNLMLQSDLADAQEKIRVQQGRQGIQQFNIGQKQRAEEINSQNQAAYQNSMAAYKQAQGANIGAMGTSLFNYITAKKVARNVGYANTFNSIATE